MNTPETLKIFVVDSRDEVREKVCALLKSKGFDVDHFNSAVGAIPRLEKLSPFSYALIISGYRMPVIKGDEFLEKAGTLLPDTPRILITDPSDIYSIINTVNAAGIKSCITFPFDDDEFLMQVDQGIEQFQAVLKRYTLERVTENQNKKMYVLATRLRKIETESAQLIKERENKIRILKSRAAHKQNKASLLENFITVGGVILSPEGIHNTFLFMKDVVKQALEKASVLHDIKIQDISYQEIREITAAGNTFSEEARPFLPLFLEFINANYLSEKDPNSSMDKGFSQEYLELAFSEGKTKALIRTRTNDPRVLNLNYVKQFLEQNGVNTGIKNDHLIELWISCAAPESEAFIIAEGREPIHPRNAQIIYLFPVDILPADKLKSDGTIDFREKGETPFVLKNSLLAEKISALAGSPGLDVCGNIIQVGEAIDQPMGVGEGVRLSLDGLKMYATIDGQPYLDALGNISVYPELRIDGDVDYETGNIRFDGNIIVKGTVKHGFSVKGATLTAEHIEGAESIELTGDLFVSSGIVDATHVMVMGSIHARYINRSKIHSFGDLFVKKEIFDSTLRVSGALINEAGMIISSDISAKRGVFAGTIGTEVSSPSRITVGVDVYLNSLIDGIDEKLNQKKEVINRINTDISKLEQEHDDLHGVLCEHAKVQDECQNKLLYLKEKLAGLRAAGTVAELQRFSLAVKALDARAKQAEKEISLCFEKQDKIDREISKHRDLIENVAQTRETLQDEKKRWVMLSEKEKPLAEVKISKVMLAGTRINAPHSTIVTSEPLSRCRIAEGRKSEMDPSPGMYEMKIIRY